MLNNIKTVFEKWFIHLSIKRKLTYLYLPAAIIPMLLFALFTMHSYEKTIIQRTSVSMEDNSILMKARIENILDDAESASTFLTISINNLVNSQAYSGKLQSNLKQYSLISNELSYAKLIYQDIDSIAFLDKRSTLYYSDLALQNNAIKTYTSDMLKALEETNGDIMWFDMEGRDYLVKNPDDPVVTLGKKIWNINSGETIGYLIINISHDRLVQVIEHQMQDYTIIGNKGRYSVTADSDKILREIDNEAYKQFMFDTSSATQIIKNGSQKEILSKIDIPHLGWTLLGASNLNALTADLDNLLLLSGLLLLMIIFLEISMSLVLNNLITSPILKLKKGVEELGKGNFEYRFKMKTEDEIGLFARSFNRMSEEIADLMQRIELEEKRKREYELALIQEQIKPHFLYNSLDIIMKLSQMGQARKAQRAIMKLADYYRRSLSGGADQISLKDELQLTEDYLALQKIRYGDLFDFKIDIDESLYGYFIPKLTLQPIVENAIYHGLKYKSENEGLLEIEGSMKENEVIITISDNGVGMNPERLRLIKCLMENMDTSAGDSLSGNLNVLNGDCLITHGQHFGLRNVNERLVIYFGKAHHLKVESEIQVGTRVTISIPRGGTK